MGDVVVNGSAVGQGPPPPLVGDIKLYADEGCTQPLPTTLVFGQIPYDPEGNQAAISQPGVYCKNESNYPMQLSGSVDHPELELGWRTEDKLIGSLVVAEVRRIVLMVVCVPPSAATTYSFTITITGTAIGAP